MNIKKGLLCASIMALSCIYCEQTKAVDVSNFSELQSAISSATEINFADNITAGASLGSQGQSSLTVNGQNYSLSGGNHAGFTVGSGQTLNVNNFSNWSGFNKSGNGVIISNTAGTVNISGSTFSSNTGNASGVIYNHDNSTVSITNSIFNDNTARNGGVILNYGQLSNITGTYSGNIANQNGGVIYNGDAAHSSASVGVISGTFENNKATSGVGGVMYISRGTVSDLSGTFRNNSAGKTASDSAGGGAIYSNANTTLNITTTSGNTLFTGNTDKYNGANDLRIGGTVNMNAGEGKTITFDGTVVGGTSGGRVATINDSAVKADMTKGTVIFNNTVKNLNLTLNDGILKLGTSGDISNLLSFTVNGGTLDISNNGISDTNLGTFTLNDDLNISIDADLANSPAIDTLSGTVTANGHNITIDAINIISDPASVPYNAIFTTSDSIKDCVALSTAPMVVSGVTPTQNYLVTYSNTNGRLTFDYWNLVNAVANTSSDRSYNLVKNEDVNGNLGSMAGGSGAKLTVNGASTGEYTVNGQGHQGITVNSGQTLTINNIGADDNDGWNGFSSSHSGGAILNKGTNLSINNVKFKNNSTGTWSNGGAIANEEGGHIKNISGSVFENNSANNGNQFGGAISNSGWGGSSTIDLIENTGFKNNFANRGGAIYNENYGSNTGIITKMSNVGFTQNTAVDGGAIYNLGTITEITGAQFNQNSVSHSGGVILNRGSISVNGTFMSNHADNVGGVMYLDEGTATVSGVFENNSANFEGGAIYSDSNTILNIITAGGNTLFKGNTDSSGSNAIHNGGTINMNAESGKSITFNDVITGGVSGQRAIILNNASDSSARGGSYIFNNIVTGNSLKLENNANVILSTADDTTYGNLNLIAFSNDANGGTINAQNNALQDSTLGAVNLASNLNIDIDVHLKDGGSADTLTATSVSGDKNIYIEKVQILSDATVEVPMDVYVANSVLKDTVKLATNVQIVNATGVNSSYLVTDNIKSDGYYMNFKYSTLPVAVVAEAATRTYVMGSDESVTSELGAMGAANSSLTINGNSNSVHANGVQGISVAAGQTLAINNVGDNSSDTSKGFNGFNTTSNGAVLSNNGKMSIDSSKFTNNSAGNGGAIYNNGGTSVINNSVLKNNTASANGGAIYNNTGVTTFSGEIASNNATSGSAVYNANGTVTLVDANVHDNSASGGAAIYNGNILNIIANSQNTTLTGNTNDIENTGSLNLNAGGSNQVQVGGNISGGTIYINKSYNYINGFDSSMTPATVAAPTDGKVVLKGVSNVNSVYAESGDFDNEGTLIGNLINNGSNINNTNTINGNVENNATFSNNGSITGNINNSGTYTNNNSVNGDLLNSGTFTTAMSGVSGAITNTGDLHYTNSGNTLKDITGTGTVHFDGAGVTTLNHNLAGNTLSLNNGTLIFGSNKDISAGGFVANGGTIDALDGATNTVNLGDTLVNGTNNINIDFDLSSVRSDQFIGNYSGSGVLNIDNIRVQGNTLKDSIVMSLSELTKIDNSYLSARDQKLPEIMTPIRRLSGKVENKTLSYLPTGNGVRDFNPSVLASPVATLVSGFLTQAQILQDGFYHMNRYSKYTQKDRIVAENINKNASVDDPVYKISGIPETSQSMWIKPYTTFERVDLRGGLDVSNVSYGALYGGDSDLKDLGHGYKGVLSAFIGYNGAHTAYSGISMNQEGGSIGLTGTLYKGNFFTGLTASAGGSAGQAYTSYGTDHFAMLTAGIANKTGYNWEIKGGRIIVQPALFVGYTFVNTFDYTNSAGARIDSDPLNVLQIVPGIKIIGNTKNGWQPYAGIDMVWNIMGDTHFKAQDSRLPQLSVKPYVQYGVGLQKSWGERFSAFFQTMIRNGGRTGVVLTGGFNWKIGKNYKKKATTNKKTIIKQ